MSRLTPKKIYTVFIPAILLGALALFIQIIIYEPLYPKIDPVEAGTAADGKIIVPILPVDPILGDTRAPITIIAFEDFACEGCRRQHEMFVELERLYPKKVKIIWKGIPVNQFPHPSLMAHRYGFCANQQKKFAEFASYAYANNLNLSESTLLQIMEEIGIRNNRLATCLASDAPDSYIATTEEIARFFNVMEVPTFFIDNVQIRTPQSLESWRQTLDL